MDGVHDREDEDELRSLSNRHDATRRDGSARGTHADGGSLSSFKPYHHWQPRCRIFGFGRPLLVFSLRDRVYFAPKGWTKGVPGNSPRRIQGGWGCAWGMCALFPFARKQEKGRGKKREERGRNVNGLNALRYVVRQKKVEVRGRRARGSVIKRPICIYMLRSALTPTLSRPIARF